MPLINDLVPLVLFVALILAASLYGLAVAGHFPRRQKGTAFASCFGAIVLFGSMALTIVTLAGGILAALHFVPWYAAIIGAGAALLAAPLVLRCFPDRFVDGRGAPLALAGISASFALVLIWLVVGHRCVAGPGAQIGGRPTKQPISLILVVVNNGVAWSSIVPPKVLNDRLVTRPGAELCQPPMPSVRPIDGRLCSMPPRRNSPSAAITPPRCATLPPRPP